MAKWLKATLFGRQLSHGSDKDSPETFSEALQEQQSPFNFEGPADPYMQNVEEQQSYGENMMPTLTPSGVGAVQAGPSPGASGMKAAYTVSANNKNLIIVIEHTLSSTTKKSACSSWQGVHILGIVNLLHESWNTIRTCTLLMRFMASLRDGPHPINWQSTS